MRWIWAAVLVSGCADVPPCDAPEHNEYDCAPVASTDGCQGGPKNTFHPEDGDKVFPTGCHVTIPECSTFYRTEARSFTCQQVGSGYGWVEPL